MKKQVRKEILARRAAMSIEEVNKLSRIIQKNIIEWEEYKKCNTIMAYMDFRNEVKTNTIINEALINDNKVILPKSIKEDIKILPCIINSTEELKVGEYGILEPDDSKIADLSEIQMVLVPGVAFDVNGYRLGYGAGYYDRFLKDYKGIKVGLCFNMQIVENVYRDKHDVYMNYLVTERGILKIGD